jgi:hypothetical protein
VITGYNTDVEFDGVVYHIQTEDKGLQTPVILSLVYSGGAILASKRSPYDDLVARGFDEGVLAARLQRQHKLICAAVHAGRIDDLKKLAERESSTPAPAPVASEKKDEKDAAQAADQNEKETEADRFSISGDGADETGLTVALAEKQELRAGKSVVLHLKVRRHGPNGRERVAGARVTVKTLGTTFAPQSTFATTDVNGAATVSMSLPDFKSGRAAVLIQAESDGEVAELRKIILPSKT